MCFVNFMVTYVTVTLDILISSVYIHSFRILLQMRGLYIMKIARYWLLNTSKKASLDRRRKFLYQWLWFIAYPLRWIFLFVVTYWNGVKNFQTSYTCITGRSRAVSSLQLCSAFIWMSFSLDYRDLVLVVTLAITTMVIYHMLMISSCCVPVSMDYKKCFIYVIFFSNEYFVTYNAHKTIAICYGKTRRNPKRSLHLNESSIRCETSVKYLGNMHCSSMSDCNDVTYKKHIYISSVNKLNSHFAFASSATKAKLLQTYCSAWYGSQNWQLNTEAVRGFHTEWNKAVRRTLGLPACTRSRLLTHMANNQSFTAQIEYRWMQFYKCMLSSDNEKVSYIARRSLDNSIGCLGKNRIHIRSKFDLVNINDMSRIPKEPINSNDYARSQMIKELLDVKEENSHISFFHNEDLQDIWTISAHINCSM